MNRRILVFLVLVVALVVAIAFIAPNTKNNNKGESEPASGLADSIFDDDSEEEDDKKQDAVDKEQTEQKPSEQQSTQKPSEQKPSEQKPDTQKPADSDSDEDDQEDVVIKEMDYETFTEMSPSKQQEYMESFSDLDAFFDWYNKAKQKYEKEHPSIEVGGGAVDLDKIVGGE